MTDEYFMNVALKEAKKAYKKGEIPIGAVIVKNNKIISKAHNCRENNMCTTDHAEIIAIKRACKKLKNWRLINCIIYITMYPCPMCASAINQARISKIVYGTIPEYVDKNVIKKILENKYYGVPVEITGGVLENEAVDILKKFFIEKRV